MDKSELLKSINLACSWLGNVAQIKTDHLTVAKNRKGFQYDTWKGAIRGEYSAGRKEWDFFCPVWHTGQAVKAMVDAYKITKDEKHLQSAKLGAEFITNNQIFEKGHTDFGLILAYEDFADKVNTSAILECMDGLMHLAELEQNDSLWGKIVAAGEFVMDKMFMPEHGLFRDSYDPQKHEVELPNPFRTKNNIGGRPLIDDAIFVKLYEKTGDAKYLDLHVKVSERLIADQRPAGNWVDYAPCNADKMCFHPRHTYWWGKPLLDTYHKTNRKEFLETAIASGEFTLQALRADGGWIRGLFLVRDNPLYFNTSCFDHVTSGSACASIFFMELYDETKDKKWLEAAEKAIGYCMRMQVKKAEDPNMQGVIIEKVVSPDGTDKNPYHIRDLGTIFFITAATKYFSILVSQQDK